ncbi:hypothetical protein ACWCOW_38075 [Streptomyces sp. NPDC001939]
MNIGGCQASWHIAARDADLFAAVEHVPADDPRVQWNGHTTEEKYAGIAAYAPELMQRCGPECSEGHTYTGRCETGTRVQVHIQPDPPHLAEAIRDICRNGPPLNPRR